jgi:ubiquinone/menaquinone biosynthesis C-methylase UbiE
LASAASAQDRSCFSAEELRQAELEVPHLVDVLALEPGMTVADVGAGFGAWTVVLAKWLGPTGRVYSTDIVDAQLNAIGKAAAKEGLQNVSVLKGSRVSASLPDACCDAILMRDVYHYILEAPAFNETLHAALRSGGRLAIVDFEPEEDSSLPSGVNPNRGGHGISTGLVVAELEQVGLHHVTTLGWPPGSDEYFLVLLTKP